MKNRQNIDITKSILKMAKNRQKNDARESPIFDFFEWGNIVSCLKKTAKIENKANREFLKK